MTVEVRECAVPGCGEEAILSAYLGTDEMVPLCAVHGADEQAKMLYLDPIDVAAKAIAGKWPMLFFGAPGLSREVVETVVRVWGDNSPRKNNFGSSCPVCHAFPVEGGCMDPKCPGAA